MIIRNEIAKYQIGHMGKREKPKDPVGKIMFYNTSDQYIGQVQFYTYDQELPFNAIHPRDQTVLVTMRIDRLDSIVDTLRNEKPCYLYYNSPTLAAIHSGQEPIGEEETEE